MKREAMKVFFTVLGFSLLLVSCNTSKKLADNMQVNQGISGQVKEKKGNQMPSPDVPEQEGTAFKTTIHVYESTHISQVIRTGTGPFYDSVLTRFIKSVDTDEDGRFSIDLPAGSYSIFAMVNGKLYANHFDSHNNISPVQVEDKKITDVNITVSASASY